MIYAQAGLVGKTLNDGELTEIKNKKQKLETRKKNYPRSQKTQQNGLGAYCH